MSGQGTRKSAYLTTLPPIVGGGAARGPETRAASTISTQNRNRGLLSQTEDRSQVPIARVAPGGRAGSGSSVRSVRTPVDSSLPTTSAVQSYIVKPIATPTSEGPTGSSQSRRYPVQLGSPTYANDGETRVSTLSTTKSISPSASRRGSGAKSVSFFDDPLPSEGLSPQSDFSRSLEHDFANTAPLSGPSASINEEKSHDDRSPSPNSLSHRRSDLDDGSLSAPVPAGSAGDPTQYNLRKIHLLQSKELDVLDEIDKVTQDNIRLEAELKALIEERNERANRTRQEVESSLRALDEMCKEFEMEMRQRGAKQKEFYEQLGWMPKELKVKQYGGLKSKSGGATGTKAVKNNSNVAGMLTMSSSAARAAPARTSGTKGLAASQKSSSLRSVAHPKAVGTRQAQGHSLSRATQGQPARKTTMKPGEKPKAATNTTPDAWHDVESLDFTIPSAPKSQPLNQTQDTASSLPTQPEELNPPSSLEGEYKVLEEYHVDDNALQGEDQDQPDNVQSGDDEGEEEGTLQEAYDTDFQNPEGDRFDGDDASNGSGNYVSIIRRTKETPHMSLKDAAIERMQDDFRQLAELSRHLTEEDDEPDENDSDLGNNAHPELDADDDYQRYLARERQRRREEIDRIEELRVQQFLREAERIAEEELARRYPNGILAAERAAAEAQAAQEESEPNAPSLQEEP